MTRGSSYPGRGCEAGRFRLQEPRRWSAVVGLAIVVGACQTSAEPDLPLTAGPPMVEVAMRDYRFDYLAEIPAGRVVFRVTNAGTVAHELRLRPLPEDMPPIEEQLRGSQRRIISPFAGVPALNPGESASFAVDLVPGRRYALLCFLRDDEGIVHATKGMASEFRAADAGPGGS